MGRGPLLTGGGIVEQSSLLWSQEATGPFPGSTVEPAGGGKGTGGSPGLLVVSTPNGDGLWASREGWEGSGDESGLLSTSMSPDLDSCRWAQEGGGRAESIPSRKGAWCRHPQAHQSLSRQAGVTVPQRWASRVTPPRPGLPEQSSPNLSVLAGGTKKILFS